MLQGAEINASNKLHFKVLGRQFKLYGPELLDPGNRDSEPVPDGNGSKRMRE
jgi:hypothetical protein